MGISTRPAEIRLHCRLVFVRQVVFAYHVIRCATVDLKTNGKTLDLYRCEDFRFDGQSIDVRYGHFVLPDFRAKS